MPAAHASAPRRLVLIGVLFLVVVAVHLAGMGPLRYVVERELHSALPMGSYIGEVHLTLFTGALETDGFERKVDSENCLRAGRLVADVNTLRLWTGMVNIERAGLRNGFMRVDRQSDGSFNLGLPPFGSDAEPLDLLIDGVVLRRVTIRYRDGDLASTLSRGEARICKYSLTP